MKSIRLNQISANAMNAKEMNAIKGGEHCCGCGCKYANSGGSSSVNNGAANNAGGLKSKGSSKLYCCEYNAVSNEVECGF
ncbi:MAG: TIGR04149 family rSAM-modified RiPP [Prevotellaceae bacterium]|jgi:natural product precursor|nr:TIGR04149 family rSAM-modified RiPP [Prevotellaceae bacterium]